MFAPALDDAIESDVILKRVGANHVVIVGVLEPHGDAPGLIDLAGDRLESDFNVKIGGGEALMDRERKPIIGAIGAGLLDRTSLRGGLILGDGPLGLPAFSGPSKGESSRS